MVSLTIDGQKIEVEEGITILKAASELGIEIPTLCYHPAIEPYQVCRVCIVEIIKDGKLQLVPSCGYKAEEGLEVFTESKKVIKRRKMIVELILAEAPNSGKVKEIAKKLGIEKSRFEPKREKECILCGLCARVCNEVMGIGTIAFAYRGAEREVTTPYKELTEICTTCGACAFVCPTGAIKLEEITENRVTPILSEFDAGLGTRPCIYIPFPQAVPNKPVIDRENCMYFKTGNCKVCETVCQPKAIVYDQEEIIIEEDIGAIIVATGFDPFDAKVKKEYAYNEYKNVITGLELERLLSASGPTAGEVVIDGKIPKQIVFVHCVGSRDESVGNEYCSRVCCMFIAKQAHLVKEYIPDAEVTVLYMDMRAFGKGYEEFYDRVRAEGVIYRRGNPSELYRKNEKLIVKAEDTILGEPVEIEADLVVLGTGLVAKKETEDIRKILKLSKSSDGFLLEAHPKLRPVDTAVDGVFIAGCCQSPKDIPDTISQAKGAASSAMSMLTRGFVTIEPVVSTIDEVACSGCGICEVSCEYGALTLDTMKKIMVVNEVLCKGCGACASACPSNAIILKHYTPKQLLSQIEAILR